MFSAKTVFGHFSINLEILKSVKKHEDKIVEQGFFFKFQTCFPYVQI